MSENRDLNNSLSSETDNAKKLSIININEKRSVSKSKIKLLDYISLVKIISVYSVVILHTNGTFWAFDAQKTNKYWISANAIESIFYFAVPMFVLCIGATLLDFTEKYGLIKY